MDFKITKKNKNHAHWTFHFSSQQIKSCKVLNACSYLLMLLLNRGDTSLVIFITLPIRKLEVTISIIAGARKSLSIYSIL